MEHHLTNRMQKYPVLIYPEWDGIEPEFKEQLMDYVRNGGNLIVVSPASAQLFESELGVTLTGEASDNVNGLYHNGWIGGVKSISQVAVLGEDAQPYGKIYRNNDDTGEHQIAASIREFGQGKIAGVYLELGAAYVNKSTTVTRDFLSGLVRELYPDPAVTVTGSHHVDVTLNRINGRLAVNLVNTSGPHQDERVNVFDDIPAIGPLQVTIAVPQEPRQVHLEPGNRPIDSEYRDGRVWLQLDRLELHDIILID